MEFLISYLYRPLKMGDSENIPERWDLIDDWVAVLLKKILAGGRSTALPEQCSQG